MQFQSFQIRNATIQLYKKSGLNRPLTELENYYIERNNKKNTGLISLIDENILDKEYGSSTGAKIVWETNLNSKIPEDIWKKMDHPTIRIDISKI